MKKKTSRKRHLFLTKNFILMLVMLVVIIVAVSAWFTQYKTVTADNITVKAVSSEIDIAPSVKTYNTKNSQGELIDPTKNYYDVLTDGPGEFSGKITFKDYKLTKDCTGDGVNLIVPEFNVTKDYNSVRLNGGKEVNTTLMPANALSSEFSRIEGLKNPDQDPPEYQYIQCEFYLRCKNPELLLQSDSKLIAKTEVNGNTLSTTLNLTDPKRSAYGNFNVDGLVGAMRVSLVGQACSSVNQSWEDSTLKSTIATLNSGGAVRQLLWVPRPDVHLNVDKRDDNISDWTLSTNVTRETVVNEVNIGQETYKHDYYRTIYDNNQNPIGAELVTNDNSAIISSGAGAECQLGQTVNISNFSTYQTAPSKIDVTVDKDNPAAKDYYYVTKYTLRIWIEGTDSEARRAMDGGEFNLELFFA